MRRAGTILVVLLLAGPSSAQETADFLGLRARLTPCVEAEGTLLFPDRPGEERSGVLADCPANGRITLLWGELDTLPLAGEPVLLVFTGSEGGPGEHHGFLATASGVVTDLAGQPGNAALRDLIPTPVPAPSIRGGMRGVTLEWQVPPIDGLAGFQVYRVNAWAHPPQESTPADYAQDGPIGYVSVEAAGPDGWLRFTETPPAFRFLSYTIQPVLEGRIGESPDPCAPEPGTFCASFHGEPLLSPDSAVILTAATADPRQRIRR